MILTLALLTQTAIEDNWHQWRGPLGNGFSPKGDPPEEWSGTRNVKWKVEISGSGYATPIIWGEKLFALTAVSTGSRPRGKKDAPSDPVRFDVLCLDRKTGKELWRRTAAEEVPHEGVHSSSTYASASPMTDGKRLIVPFGSRGIFAYDLDGNQLWKVNLGRMNIKNNFGEGASPVLHRDSVVVSWDHEGASFLVCLDAATGKEKWRQPRNEGTTWVTPFIVEHAGTTQVVVNGTGRTRSYDFSTGKQIWECGGQASNPIAVPVAREGLVYCMTGHRGFAVYAIRLDSKGDVTDTAGVAWKLTDNGPYVASPLPYGDALYFIKGREGYLSCVDAASGQVRFGPERLPGIDSIYASITGAAGKVFVVGRNGKTLVFKHGPKFEIIKTNDLGEGVDASPAIVGKQIFLRGARHLYCIGAD